MTKKQFKSLSVGDFVYDAYYQEWGQGQIEKINSKSIHINWDNKNPENDIVPYSKWSKAEVYQHLDMGCDPIDELDYVLAPIIADKLRQHYQRRLKVDNDTKFQGILEKNKEIERMIWAFERYDKHNTPEVELEIDVWINLFFKDFKTFFI